MVFSGVQGAPATGFPEPVYTTLATTPVSREKPYLYLDAAATTGSSCPRLRTNSSGTTLGGRRHRRHLAPAEPVLRRQAGRLGGHDQRRRWRQGLNLLFTPGIYHINQTINVTRANTVVLGLGYATDHPGQRRRPDAGGRCGRCEDRRPALRRRHRSTRRSCCASARPARRPATPPTRPRCTTCSSASAARSPGKATISLVVNSHNTLIDHIWAWRGDHGSGIGWTVNTADTGVIVNGNNVTALGLFVEHYQKYQVIWNGQGGRTIFFQNEMPYDPPTQAAWRTGTNGYAAYKVADTVTTHEAWGVGSYCYFNVNPSIVAARGFEVPNTPNVRFHSILTVSLGGNGVITNVINTTGGPAQGTATIPSKVTNYP